MCNSGMDRNGATEIVDDQYSVNGCNLYMNLVHELSLICYNLRFFTVLWM